MDHSLDLFMNFLAVERGLARNTLDAYGRDLARYLAFLQRQGVTQPAAISACHVLQFLAVDATARSVGQRDTQRAGRRSRVASAAAGRDDRGGRDRRQCRPYRISLPIH
jgi:integrase/recombinase XerD